MKCRIQWVSAESKGEPTPDDNEAIGVVQCHYHDHRGYSESEEFPICAEHARTRLAICDVSERSMVDGTKWMSWWTFRLLTDEEKGK